MNSDDFAHSAPLTDAALAAIGTAYRHNWSDFDGRSLRAQLDGVRDLLAAEAAGDMDRAEHLYWGVVVGFICTVMDAEGNPCHLWTDDCDTYSNEHRDRREAAISDFIAKARAARGGDA